MKSEILRFLNVRILKLIHIGCKKNFRLFKLFQLIIYKVGKVIVYLCHTENELSSYVTEFDCHFRERQASYA